jgi:hypothetical protein
MAGKTSQGGSSGGQRGRCAKTGRFVKQSTVRRHPDSTVNESPGVGSGRSERRASRRHLRGGHEPFPLLAPRSPCPGQEGPQRPPATILTATIETIDNDQVVALLPGVTLP